MAALCAAAGASVCLVSSLRGNGCVEGVSQCAALRVSPLRRTEWGKRAIRGRCRVTAVLDDFDYSLSGPIEPFKPKFTRDQFEGSGLVVEIPESDDAQKPRRRKGRKYKKATPPEVSRKASQAKFSHSGPV